MTPLLEPASCSGLRVLLPRKDENDILAFVTERHSIGEGILPRNPPDVDSQGLIHPRSRVVERLMAHALNHACQLLLRTFGRHTCDKTDDSRHIVEVSSRASDTDNVDGRSVLRSPIKVCALLQMQAT